MSTTYLTLTNHILESLSWNEVLQGDFGSPGRPASEIKRLINEAKDETLARLGLDLRERDFYIETREGISSSNSALTSTLTVNRSTATFDTLLFGAVAVGDKMICDIQYTDGVSATGSGGDGLSDNQPHTVETIVDGFSFTVDEPWRDSSGDVTPGSYTIYQDEYDLDATARQILTMNTSDGDVDLCFTDIEEFRHQHLEPTFGTPREAAIFRSSTTGKIWRIQLHPVPLDRQLIRYRAVTRTPDLSDYDDFWELEPEIVTMIQDRATYKALMLPSTNSDPQLAVYLDRDLERRAERYVDSFHPPAAGRRRRRRGPDEEIANHRLLRLNWNVENPTS